MQPLEQRLTRLAERRPPVEVGALIARIESQMAEGPVRRMSPAMHPVRAMALAATAMLVFVGGVAVGHWAFGSVGLLDMAFERGGGWGTPADVNALAFVVAGASGGGVLLLGALNLAWNWRRRRTAYRSSMERGGIMETMAKTKQTIDPTERVVRINRWMALGLVLALAALVGLGAWLLVDNLAQTDHEALIQRFNEASNSDAAALAELFTVTGILTEPAGEYTGRAEIEAHQREWQERYDFRVEWTGDVIEFANFAVLPARVHIAGSVPYEGFEVFEFSGDLVNRFYFVGGHAPGG